MERKTRIMHRLEGNHFSWINHNPNNSRKIKVLPLVTNRRIRRQLDLQALPNLHKTEYLAKISLFITIKTLMPHKGDFSDLFRTRIFRLRPRIFLGHQLNLQVDNYSEVDRSFNHHCHSQPLVVRYLDLVLRLVRAYSVAVAFHSNPTLNHFPTHLERLSVCKPRKRYSLYSSSWIETLLPGRLASQPWGSQLSRITSAMVDLEVASRIRWRSLCPQMHLRITRNW